MTTKRGLLTGPNRVRFRLGAGASTTAGGHVDVPGAALPSTTTVRFEVQDDPNVIDASHTNRATINYVATTIGQPFTYVTNETVTPIIERGSAVDEDLEPRPARCPART